jgi:hypothetical protein
MCNIIVRGGPVSLKQQIYVVEDGKIIDVQDAYFEEVAPIIQSLATHYEINKVQFAGSITYMQAFVEQLKDMNLTQYSKQIITFEYI